MFDYKDCKGKLGRFYSPTTYGIKAYYNQSQMWQNNAGNNRMDSILVPFGTSVYLWDGSGFNGSMLTLVGQPFLDVNQAVKCLNVSDLGWNNKVSSLSVYKTFGLSNARGYQKNVASGQTISLQMSVTFTTSKSESQTSTEQYTLSEEMKMGIEFESDTISESFSTTLTQASTSTYSESSTNTITVGCETGGQQTGLW